MSSADVVVVADYLGIEGRWLEVVEFDYVPDKMELHITGPNRGIHGRISLTHEQAATLGRRLVERYGKA